MYAPGVGADGCLECPKRFRKCLDEEESFDGWALDSMSRRRLDFPGNSARCKKKRQRPKARGGGGRTTLP